MRSLIYLFLAGVIFAFTACNIRHNNHEEDHECDVTCSECLDERYYIPKPRALLKLSPHSKKVTLFKSKRFNFY